MFMIYLCFWGVGWFYPTPNGTLVSEYFASDNLFLKILYWFACSSYFIALVFFFNTIKKSMFNTYSL